ncbi:hypothetical protein PG988_003829 [Apiospora saccharicola]
MLFATLKVGLLRQRLCLHGKIEEIEAGSEGAKQVLANATRESVFDMRGVYRPANTGSSSLAPSAVSSIHLYQPLSGHHLCRNRDSGRGTPLDIPRGTRDRSSHSRSSPFPRLNEESGLCKNQITNPPTSASFIE